MSEDKGILLESGTNELELLEFVVGNQEVKQIYLSNIPSFALAVDGTPT